MASAWESHGEPMTSLFVTRLLDRASVRPGTRLIDLAAGTGALAAAAAHRGAKVLATDIAPDMVARAAARLKAYPGAEARVMDAQTLPLADGSFDVATSLFGVTCADDWHAALSEMARVVRPDGTVAVMDWAGSSLSGPAKVMAEALRRLKPSDETEIAGRTAARTEHGLRQAMAAAGLVDIRFERVRATSTWPPADRIVAEAGVLFDYIPAYAALTDEERQRLAPIVVDTFASYAAGPGGPVEIEDEVMLVIARRPT